jgi:dTDP-glucose 4,6-dehydratase
MSKRILVTGGAGFVGSHFVEHTLTKRPDWKIELICNFSEGGVAERLTKVPRIAQGIEEKKVTVHISDLERPLSKYLVERLRGVDLIANYASNSHVDRSLVEPASFFEGNIRLVLNMLELAREIKPKVFLQVSTDEVYGPAHGDHRHKEWETIAPSNPYSASKAAQEAAVFTWWRAYGVPVIITNTMNIVGERQDSEKFVPMTLKKILNDEVVTIHALRRDASWIVGSRYYLHARNQADACLFLLEHFEKDFPFYTYQQNEKPPRYHVVGDYEVNNLVLAQAIAVSAGRELRYEFMDAHSARPGHDLRYALDGSKIVALGWKPPVPFWESLDRLVKWTIQHPEWLL